MSSTRNGIHHRGRVAIAATLLVLLTLLTYRGNGTGELVLDDRTAVVENPSIRRLSDLATVLAPPANSTLGGRPVSNLSFAINYALGGTDVRGYRVLNLLIHLGNALLLFGVVRRTLTLARPTTVRGAAATDGSNRAALPVALAIAAVWSAHPLLTSTVGYISQRTEELMAGFYLLTLYGFIRGLGPGAATWRALSVAACALGMGSKEVMVTAPLIVLLYDRTFVAGTFAAAWRERKTYHLGLGATWLLLAFLMSTGLHERSVGFGLGVPWWRYALTECGALLRYVQLAIWPQPLVFDYGPVFVTDATSAIPAVMAAAVLVGAVAIGWRRWPRLGFLPACFLIVLAPTSSVVPVAAQPVAESRVYLPLAFAAAFGVMLVHLAIQRRGAPALAAIVIGLLALAGARNAILVDPMRLWRDTLAKRPENSRAHSNYGALLFGRGRIDEAIVEQQEALRLDPTMPLAHANLAAALLRKGRYPEALEQARAAWRLAPGVPETSYELGNALVHLDRAAEAIPYYQNAIRVRPDYADALSNLGAAFYLLGRPDDAIGCFEAALRLQPDLPDAGENLAGALAQVGRTAGAIELYRRLIRSQPSAAGTRCNLGIVLARVGRLDEAEAEFNEALRLQPDFQTARDRLTELRAFRAGRP